MNEVLLSTSVENFAAHFTAESVTKPQEEMPGGDRQTKEVQVLPNACQSQTSVPGQVCGYRKILFTASWAAGLCSDPSNPPATALLQPALPSCEQRVNIFFQLKESLKNIHGLRTARLGYNHPRGLARNIHATFRVRLVSPISVHFKFLWNTTCPEVLQANLRH